MADPNHEEEDVTDDICGPMPAQHNDSADGQLGGTPSTERVVGGIASKVTNPEHTVSVALSGDDNNASVDGCTGEPEPTIRMVFFKSATDNQPQTQSGTVVDLEAMMMACAHKGLVAVDASVDAKKKGGAFSPARYKAGTKRGNANVEAVTAFVMDLDNVDDATVNAVFDGLASRGVRAFGWSTWGSGWTKVPQAWRVIVPFAVEVPAHGWPAMWAALSESLALGNNDEATKDASRLHFMPRAPRMVPDDEGGRRENAPIQWRSTPGALFDPSTVTLAGQKRGGDADLVLDLDGTDASDGPNRPDRVTRARAYFQKVAPAVDGQRGSDATIRAAATAAWGFDLNDGEAMAVLKDWNATCVPPWSPSELARKLAEASGLPDPKGRARGYLLAEDRPQAGQGGGGRKGKEKNPYLMDYTWGAIFIDPDNPPTPAPMPALKTGTPDAVRAVISANLILWPHLPDPVDLAPIPKAPTFPVDVLPRAVADFCVSQAKAIGCPVEMVAIPVLVALAGAIGRGVTVRLREGFNARACLWGMVIAPPGFAKSPALKAATKPMLDAEGVRAAPMRQARKLWLQKKKEAEAVERAHLKAVTNAATKGTAPPDRPFNADPPAEPPTDLISVNDATVEALADLMATSRGLTFVADELASWLHGFTKYRGDGGSDAPFYLSAYSGGQYNVQRIGREARHVADCYLNVVGGIQPTKAQQLLKTGEDGLFERFLFAYPDLSLGTWAEPTEADPRVTERFARIVEDLLVKEWGPVVSSAVLRRPPAPKPTGLLAATQIRGVLTAPGGP